MSDETSINNGTAAATDALSSAAEQVRARATGAYDAAKSAAGYVGETASEYPFSALLGATGLLSSLAISSTLAAATESAIGRGGRVIGRDEPPR